MRIDDYKLTGENVRFVPSPNHSGVFEPHYPDTIILHYTAGRSAESSVKTLCDEKVKASAHCVIGRDGAVIQLIPFNTIAWHAGRSSYKGRTGFNNFSIGIEMDNAGKLTKCMSGYQAWFGKVYPESEVIEAVHPNESTVSYWHSYSNAQIERVYELCELLCENYGITSILGHDEIAPRRKIDPGPAFPIEKFRERIFIHDRWEDGNDESNEISGNNEGIVTASRLNIRSGPTISASTVTTPLAEGTAVEIVQEKDGWYEVIVPITGWVKKDYIALS